MYFDLCPLPLVPSLDITMKSLVPYPLPSTCPSSPFLLQVLIHIVKIPLSLFLSRLNTPRTCSLSSYDRCFSPFSIFVTFTALTSVRPCLSFTGEPRTACRTHMCLNMANHRGQSTSVHMLAKLSCSPRCHWHSLSQGRIAGSWLTYCPPELSTSSLQSYSPVCWPQQVLVHGAILCQVHSLAFFFVELHEISCGPFLQPVQVPLTGSTFIWFISHFSHFCIICRRAVDALCPIFLVIDEDSKQYWTHYCHRRQPS